MSNTDINAKLCPLCNKDNHCGNISPDPSTSHCWCMNSDVEFSEELLNKVPRSAKNKACICRTCATLCVSNA